VNVWSCGKASRTSSRVGGKETLIVVFLVWISCSHLGETASRETVNIDSDWCSYKNHNPCSVEIPSKELSCKRSRMARRALESRTRVAFWSSENLYETQRRKNFLKPSWRPKISLIVLWEVLKCVDIWRALAKGNSKRKAVRDEPKSKGVGQTSDCPRILRRQFWTDWPIFPLLKDCTQNRVGRTSIRYVSVCCRGLSSRNTWSGSSDRICPSWFFIIHKSQMTKR
jgi:hypothetical protein